MSRTAEQEHFGDSHVELDLKDDFRLRLPYGPGGCRLYAMQYTGLGFSAQLPDARDLQPTGEPSYVVACLDMDFDIVDQSSNVLATLTVGDCVVIHLVDNSTAVGVWSVQFSGGFEVSSDIPNGREFYDVVFSRNTLDFNLRNHATAIGYDGVAPVVFRCRVPSNITLGASSTAFWGFDTGGFPSGSVIMVTVEAGAVITGIGGIGGRGGDVLPGLLSQPGQQGGHGMRIQDDTILINYGTIQGGGGGGGGGAALSSPVGSQQSGGGGGGGAGFQNGYLQSGDPGDPARATGYGGRGGRDQGGLGGTGYVSGGDGGNPGQAGSTGTAAGGAAGDAIQRATAVTLTKIVAGTITGAETTY